ncbi:hypothetical protein D9M73_73380 [compost metagenome]
MKTWDQFYDYLLPDVPDCPLNMAKFALRVAAQQFCEKTLAWQETLDATAIAADTLNYDFNITSTQEVVQIRTATLDDRDLKVLSERDLPSNWRTNGSARGGVFTLDRQTFYVVPQASAGELVVLTVAVKPSNTATGVSNDLFANYVDEIATGAKARLQKTPKKPYTDLVSGGANQTTFDLRCSEIAWQVAKSHGQTARRTRASFF